MSAGSVVPDTLQRDASGLFPALGAELLNRVRACVDTDLAPLVQRIDREGYYPVEAFRALGETGAFSPHLAAHTSLPEPSLRVAIEAMAAIATTCMSTAFCAWCQDASGWYLENSDNAALRERLQGGIATAALLGGTGLSNPMKALSGIEPFRLRAKRVAGGYEVTGVLPWVSNLGDGHWFGTIAEDVDDPSHRIMMMVQCGQPGVSISQAAHFVALEGTGTYAVRFRAAFVSDDALLADPLGDMPRRIRPGFVLLQAGMGLGIIEGSIADMRREDVTHGHSNQYLPQRADDFADRLAALRERVLELARTPHDLGAEYLRRILTARLEVSELTLEAGQAAVLHAGARGYLVGASVHRRQREGVFVAIITPSVRHLRQELAGMARN